MYKQYQVKLEIPSLITHNAQTADPLNPFTKAIKQITSNRKKTDADLEKLAKLEYEAGLYLNKDRQVTIPGRVFEAVIHAGAKKSKEGKDALASVFVDNDAVFEYDGGPMTVEELIESDDHRLVVPVRVNTAKVMRTRPIFKNVKAEFLVSLQTEVANPTQLENWIGDAMNLVGIGDWRPRHGRGVVTSFMQVDQPVKEVA